MVGKKIKKEHGDKYTNWTNLLNIEAEMQCYTKARKGIRSDV